MRKLLAILLCSCILPLSLKALDLSGAIHVDTFGNDISAGVSFLAEENILKGLAVRAQAEYLTAKSYDIQALVLGELSRFTFGGGFALGIDNGLELPIAPGMGLLLGLQITRRLDLETAAIITFTPNNMGRLHDVRAKLHLHYNTQNSNATFGYRMKKGIATSDFINSLNFEVEAFELGIPIGLLVGSGVDFTLDGGFGLDVNVVGGLSVFAGKYGTYFAKARVGVFSTGTAGSIPYEIATGAKFSL